MTTKILFSQNSEPRLTNLIYKNRPGAVCFGMLPAIASIFKFSARLVTNVEALAALDCNAGCRRLYRDRRIVPFRLPYPTAQQVGVEPSRQRHRRN